MRITKSLGAAAVLALLAGPALAQTTGNGAATAPNGTSATEKTNATNDDTSKVTTDGYLRSSKLVGADVYNSQDSSIGTVDDLLIGTQHGKTTDVVLSVGGFLGIGSKLVEVPFSKLKINKEGHLVLAGATKESLTKLPSYTYNK
ncbi:PRC-barrel domain-containing protein [Acetobacteraceae bacterium KSS8]|uniref:PRC-barrel domain-containing protein n=1 Tax=Endosaccharibacter trunci TaxID=2812733 RepID=A0ABT1W435_9PROT|nr:PRC-barrel domain-containing protein [Acetobacteraceae bacterium KSS8]